MRLEVGDIVLGRPGPSPEPGFKNKLGWLMSLAVVRFQELFGDPAEFSHVGIVSKEGTTLGLTKPFQPYVTEALARVETEPWSVNWAGRSFAVYRYRRMTPDARRIIRNKAWRYTGRRYGWWKLLVIAGDAWLSHARGQDTRFFSRLLYRDQEPICSYLVQEFADDAWGELFGVPPRTAQPDDIGDWCSAIGHRYAYMLVYDTDARSDSFMRFAIPEGVTR